MFLLVVLTACNYFFVFKSGINSPLLRVEVCNKKSNFIGSFTLIFFPESNNSKKSIRKVGFMSIWRVGVQNNIKTLTRICFESSHSTFQFATKTRNSNPYWTKCSLWEEKKKSCFGICTFLSIIKWVNRQYGFYKSYKKNKKNTQKAINQKKIYSLIGIWPLKNNGKITTKEYIFISTYYLH